MAKREMTSLDYAEQELSAALQNRLGLSEVTATGIVEAIYEYVRVIAEQRASDALDREFNRGDYRG